MHMSKLMSLMVVGLLIGGCAGLKDEIGAPGAPIEERGATTSTATATTGSNAAPAGAADPVVETLALPGMDGATGQQMAAGTALGGSRVVGVTPEQAAMLRDPASPLSRRVIYFDLDSDAIRPEFGSLIEAHAGFLKANGAARIILQGHTDERGSRDYNLALGQRRSESVKQALLLLGVADVQIETVSLGEEKPIQEGQDEAAWQMNRRAEIYYQGE